MDPPPFTGGQITTTAPSPSPASVNPNYANSVDSSPRSWDEPPYTTTTTTTTTTAINTSKLRLMCSYGGYIYPRPHDKSLSYVGGETRIFVADRNTSLAELTSRLSKTLFGGREFVLKYQLQNEDLDSLVSVTSDEDLENMIDEYDRVAHSSVKASRLRLFLFPGKSESSVQSVDWFVNVLNGANSGKVFSESGNCLLGLDSTQDVQSVPETPSSFGSTSSMPSLVNLPPIRVRVEENQKGGIEEQFSQLSAGLKQQKHEEGGFVGISSPSAPSTVVSSVPLAMPTQQQLQQQPQQQQLQQPAQFQSKPAFPSDLPSPDSFSSEASVTNPLSGQRNYIYQEPGGVQIQSGSGHVSSSSIDLKMSDSSGRGHAIQQVQYDQHQQMLQPQQQYVHTGAQYIHHTPSGPVLSYYPMYPSQHQTHPQQQYPFYILPPSNQAYNLPLQQQTHYSESAQSVPQAPPTMVTPTTHNPPRNPPTSKPEMVAGTYTTAAVAAPQLVQFNSGQHQPQYVAYSQIHHPSQSAAPTSATTANYAYDFADPAHPKMYYTQPLAPQYSAQYQTMMSAPAASFQETSSQLPIENLKQQN